VRAPDIPSHQTPIFWPGGGHLALAALALASFRYAKVGGELVGYGIAIIEGPAEECLGALDLPADHLS
jgi:hypothetical protein